MNTNKFVVVIAFFVAASLGFAQGMRGTGGGGMAGQPIDGTAIFPSSVTASGAITGDTLTATTTSTDAIYLNSGRPICMNAPTCNAASRIFYNGSAIQAGGGLVSATVHSTAASGAPGYTCSNVGCRLSLGNTGRYLVDDGSRLSSPSAIASSDFTKDDFNNLILTGRREDSASSVGIIMRNSFALTTAGSKLVSFRNPTTTEIASIDKDGAYTGKSFNATATSGSSFVGGNSTQPLRIESNATDSVTSSTVAAIEMKALQANAFGDMLFALRTSDDVVRMSFTPQNGRLQLGSTPAGTLAARSFISGDYVEIVASTPTTNANPIRLAASANYTADTAKLVTVYNNGSTEVAHFSKDGLLRVNASNAARPTCNADNRGRVYYADHGGSGNDVAEVCMASGASYAWQPYAFGDANASFNSCNATATSGSSFTGGNSSTSLTLTSNTTDAVTSSTVPAIRLQASQDITNSDLLMSVEDSAGNRRLSVAEDGTLNVAAIINATGQVISASQFQTTFGAFTATNVAATLQSNIGSGGTSLILRTTGTLNTDAARLVEFRNASTTAVAHMSKDGLLRVNQANAAKPTCNADNRGRVYYLDGAAGVADTYEICGKDASDVYAWKAIVTF